MEEGNVLHHLRLLADRRGTDALKRDQDLLQGLVSYTMSPRISARLTLSCVW